MSSREKTGPVLWIEEHGPAPLLPGSGAEITQCHHQAAAGQPRCTNLTHFRAVWLFNLLVSPRKMFEFKHVITGNVLVSWQAPGLGAEAVLLRCPDVTGSDTEARGAVLLVPSF